MKRRYYIVFDSAVGPFYDAVDDAIKAAVTKATVQKGHLYRVVSSEAEIIVKAPQPAYDTVITRVEEPCLEGRR